MEFSASVDSARRVRLGYGLNLHAPRTLAELLDGLRAVTLPLKARVAPDALFGVGMYLPAELAHALDDGGCSALAGLLAEHALDAFTFNAFPYARFQEDGLKERVFAPAWWERDRLDYTLAVARVAAELARAAPMKRSHVSISTHCGQFGPFEEGSSKELAAIANLARCALELAQLEERGAPRIVLALEPEPRSSCNDLGALARFLPRVFERGARFLAREHGLGASRAEARLRRHLGTCLDACHAAVEFEDASVLDAQDVLGKLQFTSALAVRDPARNVRGRAALLALDEPRFLHQTTGRSASGLRRARDLGELRVPDPEWLACDEWRCHFHVPVDLEEARDAHGAPLGLATTRAFADALLARALAAPEWALDELHVEIETYTWDVLPAFAAGRPGPEALVDGLAREYAHVVGELGRAGWLPVGSRAPRG